MILSSDEQIRAYTEQGAWGTDLLFDLFQRNSKATPFAIAVADAPNRTSFTVGEPIRLTYVELGAAVARLACGFLSLGMGRDDIVLVQLPNIAELVIVYLAAARIGAIVSPLHVQYRAHEVRETAALTEARFMITTTSAGGFDLAAMVEGIRADLPHLKELIVHGNEGAAGAQGLAQLMGTPADHAAIHQHLKRFPVTANDIFTICWTSGTEAEPKGVPRSHNHWIWIGYASVDGCRLDPGARLLNPFPLSSMAGIGGMIVPWLLTGGMLVLHQPLSLPVFLGQIGAEQIDYTVVPPTLLNMLLATPELLAQTDLSSIRCIGSGSAPLTPSVVAAWQERHGISVVNIFGSNEGASFTSGPKEFPDPTDRARFFPRFGIPGLRWASRVAEQMSTKLVNPATRAEITQPGVPGEMAIRSPGIFPGYYKRPDLTARVFDDEGYFYTGDLFEIAGPPDRLDRYKFVGRLKDIILRGGMNISAVEVEGHIAAHPKVADVAVVGRMDERLGERVTAVVVAKAGESVTLEDIVSFLKDKGVAVYKLPEELVTVAALPRNALGKVLKRALVG